MYTPNEIALETFIKNVYSCFDYFGQDGADYDSGSDMDLFKQYVKQFRSEVT